MNFDDLSGNVLQQTMVQRVGKKFDNIFVQYILGLIAAAVIGALTTWFPDALDKIKEHIKSFFQPKYPMITFVFSRDKSSTHLSRVTNAVKAWMGQIEIIVRKQKQRESQINELNNQSGTTITNFSNNITSKSNKLIQLRHVATGDWEDDFKSEKDHWIPNQTEGMS